MKKKLIFLILFFSFILLTACNSRKDIKHTNEKDMLKYVKNTIDENVSFVEVNKNDNDRWIYVFNLDDRNITFKVFSSISAFSMLYYSLQIISVLIIEHL